MGDIIKMWLLPTSEVPPWAFYGRVLWIVVQLGAVYCFANQVNPFFYQRF